MKRFSKVAYLTLLTLLPFSFTAFGQAEPDTVKRKKVLPTAPPVQEQQPRKQAQPPVVVPVPQVLKQDTLKEEKEKLSLQDRLYFGGSFGLQFGTYTNISLLPIIGYGVTEKWNVGAGVVYHYIKSGSISLNNYGGRGFTQLELFNIGDGAVLAHAEVETLSSEYLIVYTNSYEIRRKTLAIPMAGLGYRQRIGERASFDLLLLYNFSEDDANPYDNPVFRAGFNIPFTRR